MDKRNRFLFERIETEPFGTNAYILTCRRTSESLLIDAPGNAGKILSVMSRTIPKGILLTHSHWDHTGALERLKSGLRIPVYSHALDADGLPVSPDECLDEGDILTFGDLSLDVLHTPGHTPGSLCFFAEGNLFSGDTLFPSGPGKTGSPESFQRILESIENKLFILPDETPVHPGHGGSTILKKEKKEFAVFASRAHSPDLCGDVLWLSSG